MYNGLVKFNTLIELISFTLIKTISWQLLLNTFFVDNSFYLESVHTFQFQIMMLLLYLGTLIQSSDHK